MGSRCGGRLRQVLKATIPMWWQGGGRVRILPPFLRGRQGGRVHIRKVEGSTQVLKAADRS